METTVELSSCSLSQFNTQRQAGVDRLHAEHTPAAGRKPDIITKYREEPWVTKSCSFRLLAFDTNTCQTVLGLTHDGSLETFSQ